MNNDLKILDSLKLENKLLKFVLSQTPNYIYWKDKHGVYLGCNKAQAKVTGFDSIEEFVGKTDLDMPWADATDNIRKMDIQVMETGKAHTEEEVGFFHGRKNTYLSTKVPIYENYEVSGVLGVSVDITDKKELEEAKKALEISEERARVATLMSASIAHEVRTPLARLGLQLSLLENNLPRESTEANATIVAIEDALAATHHTIEMLLLKSRLKRLSIIDLVNISATDSLNKSIAEYPFQPDQKELIEINIKSDFKFSGNIFYFKHLFFNLLKNSLYAIQKARKGHIKIIIDGKKRTIIFNDTACGIPDNIMPYIFESFHTQSERGTGVGLALCKHIMEEFNGMLSCETKLNEYTKFVLSFPST